MVDLSQIVVPSAALTGANTYMIARLVILAISAGIVSTGRGTITCLFLHILPVINNL
jgi:hypothetical protein